MKAYRSDGMGGGYCDEYVVWQRRKATGAGEREGKKGIMVNRIVAGRDGVQTG